MSRDALLIVGVVGWGIAAGLAYGAIQLFRFSEASQAQAAFGALFGFLAIVAAIVGTLCIRKGIHVGEGSKGEK